MMKAFVAVSALLLVLGCQPAAQPAGPPSAPALPADPPATTAALVGDYAANGDSLSLREVAGRLEAVAWKDTARKAMVDPATVAGDSLIFESRVYRRLALGPASGTVFRITPRAPYDALMKTALAASPPKEEGDF